MFRKMFYGALALALTAVGAIGATNLVLSTGSQFLPGFRQFDGSDLNKILDAVEILRDQADGTVTHTNTTLLAAATVAGVTTPTGGIAAAGGFAYSPRTAHTGGASASQTTDGTNLSVVVTELYVAEVFNAANATITGMSVFWGDATEGNCKVMLFNSSGTRLAISATTDVSGHTTDNYSTRIAFATPYPAVGPATYWAGVICDTNTHRINTHILGNFGAGKITGLVYATESGYATITVPTTFTTGLGPYATLY